MPTIATLFLLCQALSAELLTTHYTVRGRVVDNPSKWPLASAIVHARPFGTSVQTDTNGVFALQFDTDPGCYLFEIRAVGYGLTAVSVSFGATTTINVGDIPLNPAPILEYKTLYYERCRLPDSVAVRNDMLGVDTVRAPTHH